MAACFRHVKNLKCVLLRRSSSCILVTPAPRALHSRCVTSPLARGRLCGPSSVSRGLGGPRAQWWGLSAIRGEATAAAAATELPAGYIPDPPPLPAPPVPEELASQLTSLGEPTLASLGLCNYSPPGLIQAAVEALHVGVDLPWWGAIVAGTVILRMAMFPLVILSQRNAANMANHMPTVQRLQERFTKSRQSGNPMDAARAAQELQEYMNRNNVNPLKNMVMPLIQMPVFLSTFIGLRGMANLPVPSLAAGGILWFTDLTVTDPFYALPIMTSLTFLMTVELGVDGVKAQTMTPVMRTVLRAMPLVMLPFIINFPTALLCYWFTSNTFSLCQVLLLKIPALREFFRIPLAVTHDKSFTAKKKSFKEGFRETWDNSKLAADMTERQRMDALRFKEAGTGPLQKTFPYDPTKAKSGKS